VRPDPECRYVWLSLDHGVMVHHRLDSGVAVAQLLDDPRWKDHGPLESADTSTPARKGSERLSM